MAPEKENVTSTDKSTSNDTVRIRTSAADQPWNRTAKDEEPKGGGKPVTGSESTAPFKKPAVAGSSSSSSSTSSPSSSSTSSSGSASASASASARTGGTTGTGSRPAGRPGSGSGASNGSPSRPYGAAGTAAGKAETASASASADSALADTAVRGLSFGASDAKPETGKGKKTGLRPPRKAHLVLRRIEPWSAMKFSFVVSLVCFVVLFVAVAVLYGVLSALGVFSSITDAVNQLTQGANGDAGGVTINISGWFDPMRILGYTALLGALNVVLITALSTLGAVIYNVSSDLVGGVEVTFSEAE
ncbi:DUF3566 domain-containing protein [Microbispora oryzae]|uniref:DUF3566 domain-containing protein n=1 Tax=Microbispora oryzae TaxID=2806554 RepID=UPI0027DDEADC|nr:DUF3566 domain-containing protein [Microbispora oryzae]